MLTKVRLNAKRRTQIDQEESGTNTKYVLLVFFLLSHSLTFPIEEHRNGLQINKKRTKE